MKPRSNLPHITDSPKSAFLAGWWAGLAVGAVNGLGFAVLALKWVR